MYLFSMVLVFGGLLQFCSAESSSYRNVITIYNGHVNVSLCASPAYDISSFNSTSVLQDSTEVRFCQRELSMERVWKVEGKNHIKFSGTVVIQCFNNSGLLFEDIKNLTISDVQLVNCGLEFATTENKLLKYAASLAILNSFNVSISGVNISNSTGIGLYLKNTAGEVELIRNHFYTQQLEISQSNGMLLELDYDRIEINKPLKLKMFDCYFGSGKASKGGGLKMILGANAIENNISLHHCTFKSLYSENTGALYILIKSNATGNAIHFNSSTFENNSCVFCGGGGVRLDVTSETDNIYPSANKITFFNSSFFRNKAHYGGAVSFYSNRTANSLLFINKIEFCGCNWTSNSARYGAAVDASASPASRSTGTLLLNATFINSTFTGNFIDEYIINSTTIFGKGIVSLVHFLLRLEKQTVFFKNIGSPLYLSSSVIKLGRYSYTEFFQNEGLNGAAVTILDTSVMAVKSGSVLNFTENKAYFKGGAIYYESVDGRDYLTNRKCFIQFIGSDKESPAAKKPRFIFRDNNAGSQFNKNDALGRSLYATTLIPCNRQCGHFDSNQSLHYMYIANKINTFDCVGDFEYNNSQPERDSEVATSGWLIKLLENASLPLSIIPGKEVKLPVQTKDELNQSLRAVYKAVLWENQQVATSAIVSSPYRYTQENKIVILGKPGNTLFNLSLTSEHDREIKILVAIKLARCPPGYVLHNNHQCKCSSELPTKFHYQGVSRCNATNYQAILLRGYWIGYMALNFTDNQKTLISSICPTGFCNTSSAIESERLLPSSFDPVGLDLLVCGEKRTGLLCSNCRDNGSVYYHSESYTCGSSRLCSVGWLFYTISELLPVTFVFLTVIALDFQLTSGSVNGIILYYQLSRTLSISAGGFIQFSKYVRHFNEVHNFLADMFSLHFFSVEGLSFCLWRGATTLDVIAFNYFTVLYALLLVMATVFFMRICGHRCSCVRLRRVRMHRRAQITNSVIHGLSGFLILCYSQCANISLLLLKPVLYADPKNVTNGQKYVLYNGTMTYLSGPHLKYAIPALFIILTLVAMPPLLLLTYPLCYKVFLLFGIQETRFTRILCKLLPLEKLRPFFDSFQGSFKDEHRYTSGLYFVYRLVSVCLAVFTTHNSDVFYILLEIQLVLMIFVHSYFQPYKRKKHNRQDLFFFVTLAAINALTIFNFNRSIHDTEQNSVHIVSSIQIALLFLPMVFIVFKMVYLVYTFIKKLCKRTKNDPMGLDSDLFAERESYKEY